MSRTSPGHSKALCFLSGVVPDLAFIIPKAAPPRYSEPTIYMIEACQGMLEKTSLAVYVQRFMRLAICAIRIVVTFCEAVRGQARVVLEPAVLD